MINKSDKLIQIHASAEQFDPTVENLFRQFTVCIVNSFTSSACMNEWVAQYNNNILSIDRARFEPSVCALRAAGNFEPVVVKHMHIVIAKDLHALFAFLHLHRLRSGHKHFTISTCT